jgi:hypothetical protein
MLLDMATDMVEDVRRTIVQEFLRLLAVGPSVSSHSLLVSN